MKRRLDHCLGTRLPDRDRGLLPAIRCGRLLLALLFGSACPFALATDIPASAPHCDLATPPPDAGETAVQGTLVKIYPRRSQMRRPYSGCQTSWMRHQGRWIRVSVMYFAQGELTAWWKPDREAPSRSVLCHYSQGRLEANAHAQCHTPAPEVVPGVSYAPGCIEDALRTGRLTPRCTASADHGR
jgi:hypothetical protein